MLAKIDVAAVVAAVGLVLVVQHIVPLKKAEMVLLL
jgi:hypothetical protein